MIAVGIVFLLIVKKRKHWYIPLVMSYVFLAISLLTYFEKPDIESYRLNFLHMATELDKGKCETWHEIGQVIHDHPYLSCSQAHLLNKDNVCPYTK